MAIVVSLEHLAQVNGNSKAKILADTLDAAIEDVLKNGKSPMRKVGELDNRGSHFYLAMYWAQELVAQNSDAELKEAFEACANSLTSSEETIVDFFGDFLVCDSALRLPKLFCSIIIAFGTSSMSSTLAL